MDTRPKHVHVIAPKDDLVEGTDGARVHLFPRDFRQARKPDDAMPERIAEEG